MAEHLDLNQARVWYNPTDKMIRFRPSAGQPPRTIRYFIEGGSIRSHPSLFEDLGYMLKLAGKPNPYDDGVVTRCPSWAYVGEAA